MLRLLLLLLPLRALPAAAAAAATAARPFAALAELLPLLERARALRGELPLNATTALLTRAAEAFSAARAYANASAVRGELVAVLAGAGAGAAAQQPQDLLLARLAHVEALTAERRYAQALGVLDEAGAAAGAAAAPQLAAGLLRARAQVLDCAGSARAALAALEAGLPGAPAPWPAAAAPLASPAHLRMAKQYLMLLRRAGQGGGGAAARVARALLAAGPWRRADQLPRRFHPQLTSAPFYDLGSGSGGEASGARGAPLPASWRGLRTLARALAAAAPALLREYSALAAAASPLLLQEAECIADPASGAWRYATVNAPWVEAVDAVGCAVATPVACGLLALAEREGWGGAALRGTYSAVAGGGVLREHCGMTNAQLKFHVGLRVPRRAGLEAGSGGGGGGGGGGGEPCASLTVAGETRAGEEGGVLLFDDSFVHSVVNTCPDAERVIFQLVVPHGDARGPEWDSAIGARGD